MEELTDAIEMALFDQSEEAAILKQLSAFYAFKKKGLDVVEKRYPDMLPFVREHHTRSYEEVRAGLLGKLQ